MKDRFWTRVRAFTLRHSGLSGWRYAFGIRADRIIFRLAGWNSQVPPFDIATMIRIVGEQMDRQRAEMGDEAFDNAVVAEFERMFPDSAVRADLKARILAGPQGTPINRRDEEGKR